MWRLSCGKRGSRQISNRRRKVCNRLGSPYCISIATTHGIFSSGFPLLRGEFRKRSFKQLVILELQVTRVPYCCATKFFNP